MHDHLAGAMGASAASRCALGRQQLERPVVGSRSAAVGSQDHRVVAGWMNVGRDVGQIRHARQGRPIPAVVVGKMHARSWASTSRCGFVGCSRMRLMDVSGRPRQRPPRAAEVFADEHVGRVVIAVVSVERRVRAGGVSGRQHRADVGQRRHPSNRGVRFVHAAAVRGELNVRPVPRCRSTRAERRFADGCQEPSGDVPSFRDRAPWGFGRPMIPSDSGSVFEVRSGLIAVQVAPRSGDRNKTFAPA